MLDNSAQEFLAFLKKVSPTAAITFRGYIDRTPTEPRPIGAPTLVATSHSVAIATNNLEKPEVAIFIGSNGRDLTPFLKGGASLQPPRGHLSPGYLLLSISSHGVPRGNDPSSRRTTSERRDSKIRTY